MRLLNISFISVMRIASILILALPCVTFAQAITTLRVAAQTAAEPKYILQNQEGKAVMGGLCIDIMHAIEKIEPKLKFAMDPEWQPLVRLEAGIASDKLDAICGLIRSKYFEAKYLLVPQPLFTVKYYLAVRADDNVRIDNWGDVRKLGDQGVVLAISGFGVVNKLRDLGGLRIDSSGKDSITNIQKLIAGRGRFFYHRSPGIRAEIKKSGYTDKVKLLPTVMDTEEFYMAMAKTMPPEVIEKMRKALLQLENNGELKRLVEKWDRD
jgi:polar amino acid transport system substrate-binding protein